MLKFSAPCMSTDFSELQGTHSRLGEPAAGGEDIGHLVIGQVGELLGVVCCQLIASSDPTLRRALLRVCGKPSHL
jgi:hypothetical protein